MAKTAVLIGFKSDGTPKAVAIGTGADVAPKFKKGAPDWAKSLILLDTNGVVRKRNNPDFVEKPKTKAKSVE